VHGGHRPPAAVSRVALRGGRAALGLFTVIPAADGRFDAVAATRWLPAIGAVLAVPAAGILLAARSSALLGAVLAVTVLGLLTGGLHLDGLADTADGLGSRRPREDALAIMRRHDVGPLGVAALVGVAAVQVTALASLGSGWLAAAGLALAVITGRVAVLFATGPGSPAARADGLGALVAGTTPVPVMAAAAGGLLAAAGAGGYLLGGLSLAVRGAAAVLAALAAAGLLRGVALRRLGGITGDVLGALIEVATATTLLVLAVTG
jgi:adenosylcobinamide-GDP ribazoletransferase